MSTVIYVRQSLDRDGKGAAVGRQLEACRGLAAAHTLEVAREYVDNDVSASKGTRPGFRDLLSDVRAGSVSTIIVWHTDRLYRRVSDLVHLVELAERHSLKILTVEGGDLDLNNSTGRMMAQIMGAVARQEVEHKGERQMTANMQRAKAGIWQFSNRPYGYVREAGDVQIVEHEAAVIREAFTRYLDGETYYAIAEDLNARGIPTLKGTSWTITQLRERLNNPAYAGVRVYKGEPVATGTWEPIISLDTWERFKATRSRRKTLHDWSNKGKHLLSGIAICGVCGSKMMARPEYRKTKDGPRRTVHTYQCVTSWCVSRNAERVNQLVESAVIGRLTRPDALALMRPKANIAPLILESNRLRERRDDLASALADGILSLAAVRKASEGLTKQLDDLQRKIGDNENGNQLAGLLLSDDVANHWSERTTLPQRRAVITALMTVTIKKQKNKRIFEPNDVSIEWAT